MGPLRQMVESSRFNPGFSYPYELRQLDFEVAMQDVYDFFYDVNTNLRAKGLDRLDDMLRPANLSGTVTDMLTAGLGRHARSLVPNTRFNGHPDLVVRGVYPNDGVQSGEEGVEIKSTRKRGGAVDTHGARNQTMCVFVYEVDTASEPVSARRPLRFREVYLAPVTLDDFRRNARGELGTRTATLHAAGLARLRAGWVYLDKGADPLAPPLF